MATYDQNAKLILCPFPPSMRTNHPYVCFKSEHCCEHGCCVNSVYDIYRTWYYWVLLFVIIAAFYAGSWLCQDHKRQLGRVSVCDSAGSGGACELLNCDRERARTPTPTPAPAPAADFRRSYLDNFEDDEIVLDRLYLSFRNRNSQGDPPSYTTLISQERPGSYSALYGPPPKYSSVCKMAASPDGVASVEVHAEGRASQVAPPGGDDATGPADGAENVELSNEKCEEE